MEIPIFDKLRAILDASPTGDMTYLVTEFGKPFRSGNSFATWFAKAVKRAGLSGISGHGLRKTFAATQAEEASTTNEIAALGGWEDLSAGRALHQIGAAENDGQKRPGAAQKETNLEQRLANLLNPIG